VDFGDGCSLCNRIPVLYKLPILQARINEFKKAPGNGQSGGNKGLFGGEAACSPGFPAEPWPLSSGRRYPTSSRTAARNTSSMTRRESGAGFM
jgi:hypothetical protein